MRVALFSKISLLAGASMVLLDDWSGEWGLKVLAASGTTHFGGAPLFVRVEAGGGDHAAEGPNGLPGDQGVARSSEGGARTCHLAVPWSRWASAQMRASYGAIASRSI
jgi:hypothetical protein